MTANNSTTRRKLLRTIGASGLLAGVGAVPAVADPPREPGRKSINDAENVQFAIYPVSGTNIIPLDEFIKSHDGASDYSVETIPDDPLNRPDAAIMGRDEEGVLFDAENIEMTTNGRTLHYRFRFTPWELIVGSAKPYTLTLDGEGRYTSRGQTVNFSIDEEFTRLLKAILAGDIEFEDVDGLPEVVLDDLEELLADSDLAMPIGQLLHLFTSVIEPGRWRAVGRDTISIGPESDDAWAVTRVDFYPIGHAGQASKFSLLYVIWSEDGDPSAATKEAESFLEDDGPANRGGQVGTGPGS